MRTTLIIDDHVLVEAKRQALEAGLTVSQFTTMALREVIRQRDLPPIRTRFSLPTYGSGPCRDSSTRMIANLRDDGR